MWMDFIVSVSVLCHHQESSESSDLVTAITTISLRCYHPITRSGMGRTPGNGDTVETSANQRAEGGGVDQSEGWVHRWKLWVDIRQHPQLPALVQHQHCLVDSGKTFTTAPVTWSLGINKLGGVHKSGSRDEWTMKLDNGGHYSSLYQTQRAIRIYRGPGHLLNWW